MGLKNVNFGTFDNSLQFSDFAIFDVWLRIRLKLTPVNTDLEVNKKSAKSQ